MLVFRSGRNCQAAVPLPLVLAASAVVFAAGCATHADRLRDVRGEFYAGQLAQARALLERRSQKAPHDANLLRLDRALVELVSGRPAEAERLLRIVRDQFDYLEQNSAAEHLLATATDDQRIAYAGEDYEKLLIRVFLTLASLLGDGTDAFAYAVQVSQKQQQIIDSLLAQNPDGPKPSYKRLAFGAYVQGLIYEATLTNYDGAERQYRKVLEWEPGFRPAATDLERVRTGRHSQPGNGVLYLFALVGRGPYKEQVSEVPTTAALFIADRILSVLGNYTLPPTVAPVLVPMVVLPPNRVRYVQVVVDGRAAGRTETIADIGRLAVEQYRAVFPQVVARAVVRRVVKKGTVVAAKHVFAVEQDSLLNMAMDIAGVVWEATEAADTRCWGLLPDKIQVLRLELPAGRHLIELRPVGATGRSGPHRLPVVVDEGRNSYLLAYFAESGLIGRIQTSRSPRTALLSRN